MTVSHGLAAWSEVKHPGVENVDVSDVCKEHMDIPDDMPRILAKVGLAGTLVRTSSEEECEGGDSKEQTKRNKLTTQDELDRAEMTRVECETLSSVL